MTTTPDGAPQFAPYLSVQDAPAAIAFYQSVFGAKLVGAPLKGQDGEIMHAELSIGGARMMVSEENPSFGNLSPAALGDTPVRMALEVDDADAVCDRAVASGAVELIPPSDQFYGFRAGRVRDPFGHVWIISHAIERLSDEEMQRRLDKLIAG